MTVADHHHMLTSQTQGILDRGHAMLHQPRMDCSLLTERGETVSTRGTPGVPGARRVDHRVGLDPLLPTIRAADVHDARLLRSPGIDREIPPLARRSDPTSPLPDPAAQRVRQRGALPLAPLPPGREAR